MVDNNTNLLAAYTNALYVVFAEQPITLRIDHQNRQIEQLLEGFGRQTAVFITACNPNSVQLAAAENERRMQLLLRDNSVLNLPYLHGESRDPTGNWPVEASLLLPGMDRHQGQKLARRFEQKAFVFVQQGIPRLIVC